MPGFTPTSSGLPPRLGDFSTLLQALDYAARGESGFDFYSVRGELAAALPYRRLRQRAVALAHRLVARGLGPGGRVAVVASTGPEFVEAFFACQYAGLVPAPLPMPQAFGGRTGYVAHVRRLMTGARAAALMAPSGLIDWLRPLAAELGLALCCTVDELDGDGAEAAAGPLPAVLPSDVAYLQFSSGSTRFPVGVAVLHQALMANIAGILGHGLQVRAGDRAVSWLPFYHDMGLVGFMLSPLAGQISVDFLATADFARRPMLWLSMMSERRATISYSPSFGYDLCTRRGGRLVAGLDLSCWRIAGVGGDMIRPAVLAGFARAFGDCGFDRRAFLPSYGMAEATLAISFAPVGRGIETDTIDLDRLEQEDLAVPPRDPHGRTRGVVLCGRALPGHEIRICGPGETAGLAGMAIGPGLPERRVGRVLVRGPSLMRGYDGRPDDTEAVLSADGWLDTGDLGYLLDGTLVITGRAKDLIIINGRNIWPQDLEWTIEQSLPAIRTGNVAAFSVDEDGQEVLILAAEASAPADGMASSTLTAAIADTVRAQHGIDGRVVLLLPGTLPYTSSGKLRRSAARQRYLAGSLAAVPA